MGFLDRLRMVEWKWKVSSEDYADMLHNYDALFPLWSAITLLEVGCECPQGKYNITCFLCFN